MLAIIILLSFCGWSIGDSLVSDPCSHMAFDWPKAFLCASALPMQLTIPTSLPQCTISTNLSNQIWNTHV